MKLLELAGYGPAVMDGILVVGLILDFVIGFFTGFLNRTVKVVEMFIVVFLALILKNPIVV